MMKRTVVLLSVALMLGACGGSGGEGGGANPESCSGDIRSSWVQLDSMFEFDLRSRPLNQTTTIEVIAPNNNSCELTGRIEGSACTGRIIVTGSTFTGTNPDPIDCRIFEGTSTYQVSQPGNTMDVCEVNDATDCVEYFQAVE